MRGLQLAGHSDAGHLRAVDAEMKTVYGAAVFHTFPSGLSKPYVHVPPLQTTHTYLNLLRRAKVIVELTTISFGHIWKIA